MVLYGGGMATRAETEAWRRLKALRKEINVVLRQYSAEGCSPTTRGLLGRAEESLAKDLDRLMGRKP